MANLSDHFTLEELTRSDTANRLGISNIPDDEHAANGIRLCNVALEPVRSLLGDTPIKINSGYRCPQLNAAVGGVMNSAHMDFRAADFVVPSMDLKKVWDTISASDIPFDQLLWEYNGLGSQWIHIAIAPEGEDPRRQALYLQARPFRRRLG